MTFEINGTAWTLELKPMKELLESYNKEHTEKASYLFGLTSYPMQRISITEELCRDQKILTLKHELTHCWLHNYGHYYYENINEECVCEIVAKSNDFINKIVEQFKEQILAKEGQNMCKGKKKGGRRK